MDKQQKANETARKVEYYFHYKFADTAIFYILALVSAVLACVLFTKLMVGMAGYIGGDDARLPGLLATTGYILLLIFYSLMISSAYPSFYVADSGLTVQVFLFWRVFVPWDEVRDVRSTLLGFSKLVVLHRLTPVHRVYGLIFGLTVQPAFVIRRRINDYDRAVKAIERHINCT
jgi:hypothetical protein